MTERSCSTRRPSRHRPGGNCCPGPLDGLTVGLLDISKPRGNIFLDQLDALLVGKGITVKRYAKPTFTRVAPVELKQQIASEVDVVVEGLAD